MTPNLLSDAFAAAACKAGFIVIHPLHAVFIEGKSGWQRGRPKLINIRHIIDIDIGKHECLITLISQLCLTVSRDELFEALALYE
jgi:hypothetical protein